MKNDGGNAFPAAWNAGESGEYWTEYSSGMSIRDYFAAKVLPACYAETCRECAISGFPEGWKIGVALDAYAMADAMLKVRDK